MSKHKTKPRRARRRRSPPVHRRAKKTRAQWAEEARGFQRKTVEGLIGLGKTLIKAKDDLDHGDFGDLLRDDLKMDVRFAQRVMRLARNPRFLKASNLTHLPAALSALGALADLPENAFERGLAIGAINPSTTAAQARTLTLQVEHAPPTVTPVRPPRAQRFPTQLELLLDLLREGLNRTEQHYRQLAELAQISAEQLESALAHLAGLRNLLTNPGGGGELVPFPRRPERRGGDK
jgi:hypothetical protein